MTTEREPPCSECGSFGFHRTGCRIWESQLERALDGQDEAFLQRERASFEKYIERKQMTEDALISIARLVDYLFKDEKEHFEFDCDEEQRKNHIYNHVKLVREWLSPRLDHSAWPDHIRRNIHEGENIPHLIERNREESHDA